MSRTRRYEITKREYDEAHRMHAFWLRRRCGLTYKAIGARLGISGTSVMRKIEIFKHHTKIAWMKAMYPERGWH